MLCRQLRCRFAILYRICSAFPVGHIFNTQHITKRKLMSSIDSNMFQQQPHLLFCTRKRLFSVYKIFYLWMHRCRLSLWEWNRLYPSNDGEGFWYCIIQRNFFYKDIFSLSLLWRVLCTWILQRELWHFSLLHFNLKLYIWN